MYEVSTQSPIKLYQRTLKNPDDFWHLMFLVSGEKNETVWIRWGSAFLVITVKQCIDMKICHCKM